MNPQQINQSSYKNKKNNLLLKKTIHPTRILKKNEQYSSLPPPPSQSSILPSQPSIQTLELQIRNDKLDNQNEIQNLENDEYTYLKSNRNKMNHLFCMNCGKKGHLTKKCNFPVTSIGIIAFHIQGLSISLNEFLDYYKKIQNHYLFSSDEFQKINNMYQHFLNFAPQYDLSLLDENIKYLFISRKHSMCYVVFIRGKYDLDNIEYITNTIQLMTIKEKENLLEKSFDELWIDLWSYDQTRIIYNQEYEESKIKFTKLREGYCLSKNDILLPMNLQKIISYTNQYSEQLYTETEWGFPKGRRNMDEKNLDCAKREFQEETGLVENDYHIFNISPFEEIYYGSNQICYKHIYYFAQMNELKDLYIDIHNVHQFNEIGDIRWLSISEGIQKIRNYHREKKNVLYNFHIFLKETILHFLVQFPHFIESYQHHDTK